MSSKNEKAAAARAKAQAQVKAKERKTTVVIVASAVAILAVFGGIIYFIVNSAAVPPLEEAAAPAVADETGGIPVGASGVAGEDIDADAVRVDIYLDFMCPVCGAFEEVNAADLAELREAGDITVVYHTVSILDRASNGTAFSTRSANAAAVVADKSPENFVAFVDAMFANQPEEGTSGHDDATIAEIAVGAGVPQDVADSLKDGAFTKWVIAATDQASQDGMGGTPTVMINREILEQTEVPYFQPGALATRLSEIAAG